MSDLRHIAHALRQYGRNGDDHLVHMSGREIAALHAMSPGGLSRNPDTGLPEAFNLEDILAPIAGAATAIFAPELLPWVAGAAGVGTAIGTGDIGKGILAGLGAYGGGTLAGALGVSGTSAAANGLGSLFGGGQEALSPLSNVLTGADGSLLGSTALTTPNIATGSMSLAGSMVPTAAAAPSAAISAAQQAAAAAPAASGGGIMGFIKDNPLAVPAGLMALNGISSPSGSVPTTASSNVQTPPMVQGPVANPAYWPNGYIAGYSPEQSFFQSPGTTAAGQALNAVQSPTQSLATAAAVPGGIGSQQQQALQLLQQQQAAAMGLPVARFADGGPVQGKSLAELAAAGKIVWPSQPIGSNPMAPTLNTGLGVGRTQVTQAAPQSPTSPFYGYTLGQPGTTSAPASNGVPAAAATVPQSSVVQPQPQGIASIPTPTTTPAPSTVTPIGPALPPGVGQPAATEVHGWMVDPNNPENMVYYAEGGAVSPAQADPRQQQIMQQIVEEARAAIIGQSANPEEALQRFVQVFGKEALQQLASETVGNGGAVQGAGDGTSDQVPGTIDGVQPVRLATDEHVIPADVVSGLGNGSSTAGHRVLKDMASRVRGARSNGRSMPNSIEASNYVPQ